MADTLTTPKDDKIDPRVLKTALILIVGVLAVIFDTTIVSVALHTLAARLHTSVPTIQWVTTAYLLALGIAAPLSTWGLRRFGGKRRRRARSRLALHDRRRARTIGGAIPPRPARARSSRPGHRGGPARPGQRGQRRTAPGEDDLLAWGAPRPHPPGPRTPRTQSLCV
jgi:hypothetical protein